MNNNSFTGHISKWKMLAESETDFTIMFVRCWITFNAWYCTSYSSTKDRFCLDKIKSDQNSFRAKIIALLDGSSPEALSFQDQVAKLHLGLEHNPIPDASDRRVSFRSIYFRKNPNTVTNPICKIYGHNIKCQVLPNGSVKLDIVKTPAGLPPQTVYTYTHQTKYDVTHFTGDLNQANLSHYLVNKAIDCFRELDPRAKENMILPNARNAKKIGSVYFVDDSDLISQALIEVIYALRCKLFHGELQPTQTNLSVYESAYHIMRDLLPGIY